jgi:hypothetical protein
MVISKIYKQNNADKYELLLEVALGPVVQSWISANPGLKFNLLF